MAMQYPTWEPQGQALRRWMTDANESGCPIPRTSLTLATLHPGIWTISNHGIPLPSEYHIWTRHLNLPMEHTTELDPETSYHSFAITRHNSPRTYWVGRIAPGLIFMEDIQRTRNSGSPHISEITQAVYENHFDLSTLRYIFITKVSNVDTNLAAMHVLESREGLGSLHTSTFTWEAPSAEFHALLGSRLGRLVSYFILGAYGQGVKHVARVFTFHSTDFRRELHLRFDIEDV